MKTNYFCEKCGKTFSNREECLKHEEECKGVLRFKCNKCGKVIEYTENQEDFRGNQCHHINLGQAGYGSKLDGSNIEFNLCDDCLCEFVVNELDQEARDNIIGEEEEEEGDNRLTEEELIGVLEDMIGFRYNIRIAS